MAARDEMVDLYLRYLAACNERDWDFLGAFLADEVIVNGVPRGRDQYVADVRATVAVFPDYSWELRRAVVEGDWLAVHLFDAGTRLAPFMGAAGDGATVGTDEFDFYRISDGLIREVEGTADNAQLQRARRNADVNTMHWTHGLKTHRGPWGNRMNSKNT